MSNTLPFDAAPAPSLLPRPSSPARGTAPPSKKSSGIVYCDIALKK